ncbi:MAG: toast rack family protein, partial [Anaerolineae bacterium]|nr:toast rack family protein [Anaerolineae bacterium]
VTYNVDRLEPETEYSSTAGKARVEISPRLGAEIKVLPTKRVRNDWEVWLTKEIPLSLRIEAGAFSGDFDLSGLRLINLEMRTGAARSTVSFTEPNPQELERIEIETGASEFDLLGLGYANFEEMTFQGGLGRYTFDFAGPLSRSAEVRIETGVSQVTIIVPESTGTKVILEEAVSDTDIYGFRRLEEKEYVNDAFEEAENTLIIKVRMGLGSLTLRSE